MKYNQLDQHAIVIRKRSIAELSDLAFFVLRDQWRPILLYWFLLEIPLLIFYFAVFQSLVPAGFTLSGVLETAYSRGIGFLLFLLVVLRVFESFTSSLVITYLGIWFFNPNRKIRFGEVFGHWYASLGQLLFYTLLFHLYYTRWLYLPCIVLLEKTPFFKQKDTPLTTSSRSSWFHREIMTEELTGNISLGYIMIVLMATGAGILFYFGTLIIPARSILLLLYVFVGCPLFFSMFLVYDTVRNFLRYLNIRIVREGWDVEIAVKTELNRTWNESESFAVPRMTLNRTDEWEPTPTVTEPEERL